MAVKDLGPGGNDGVATSITASDIVVGQHGDAKAIDFDGADAKVDVGSGVLSTGDISVSFWINPDSTGENGAGRLIDDGSFLVAMRSINSQLQASSDGGSTLVYSASSSVPLGVWSHVVVTRTSAGLINYYVNGTLSGSADQDGGTPTAGATNLIIGNNNAQSRTFDGPIGEVEYHTGILTELQVRDLYEQTRSASKSTSRINNPAYLKGYWPLNSNTDDYSGNGLNGTPTAVTYAEGPFGRTVAGFSASTSVDFTQLDLTAFTINVWATTSGSTSWQVSVGKDSIDNRLLIDQDGVYWEIDNSIIFFVAPFSGHSNEINMYTISYDGSQTYLYLNGVLRQVHDSTDGLTFPVSKILYSGSTMDYTINSWNYRIYDVVLTNEEIEQIYQQEQRVEKLFPVQQPYSALPDITDSSLLASWLNSATNGTAKDYSNNNNDGTATAVILGNNQGVFDGSSGDIDLGSSDFIGTGDISLAATFKASSLGENSLGRIIDNGKFLVTLFPGPVLLVNSDGSTNAKSGSIQLNEWNRLFVTRKSDGTANIYVNGQLSGDANQSSGTPASAITNIFIGNNSSGSRTFDGIIKDVEIFNEIKSLSHISSDYIKRVPDANLVLWLKDSLDDKSRYNRTGTTVNIIEGNKLDFNGTDSVFSTGSDWISTNDITLMGWINPDSFGEANEGRIFDNGKTIFFINSTLNRLRFTSDGGSTQSRADNAISTGQWQHVAVTRNGTMSTLYVNGVDVTDVGDSGTPASGSTVVFIGNNQAGSRTFDGKMDDVRGYNRILTASEIKSHYLQTRGQY